MSAEQEDVYQKSVQMQKNYFIEMLYNLRHKLKDTCGILTKVKFTVLSLMISSTRPMNLIEKFSDFQKQSIVLLPHFNSTNSRKKVRSYFLQDLYKRPPAKLLEIGKYFIPLPKEQRRELLKKIKDYLKKTNKQVLSKDEKKLPIDTHKA